VCSGGYTPTPIRFVAGLVWGYTYGMFKLLDKAFWKFASGFIFILLVSFSVLALSGVLREAKKNYSAVFKAVHPAH